MAEICRALLSDGTTFAWSAIVAASRRAVLAILTRIQTGQLVVFDATLNIVTVCGALEAADGVGAGEANGGIVKEEEEEEMQIAKEAARRRNGEYYKSAADSKTQSKPTTTSSSSSSTTRTGKRAELRVQREVFWLRMLLFADMGFAESFMLGEVVCEDLVSFFEIFIANRAALSNATTMFSSLASTLSSLLRRSNTLANARLNASAHYDISNAMFAAFLSPDMTYSCPIWTPTRAPASELLSPLSSSLPSERGSTTDQNEGNEVETPVESLEAAQLTKLRYIIDQARIKAGDHVLEIGTGWGSFAIEAARRTGCRVTSLTLSREQKELAEQRIAAAGLDARIAVLLCDYRALPQPPAGSEYDKVISIEMLEAVGAEFLGAYFGCVDRLLKPDGGIAVFQCSTIPERRYAAYARGDDFIRRYIFPGGHLPTVSQLVRSIDAGSRGALIVENVRNIGGHYARTLRLWRENFHANFDTKIRPALLAEHRDMNEQDVQLFHRKWEYYFTYCEAAFRTKTLSDVIITVGREGATEMIEDVPL